jgi:single-stranded-DNA-specific exonuclease
VNAAGRIESADIALRLCLADEVRDARVLARQLDGLNRQRKRIEDEILKEATEDWERREREAGPLFGVVVGRDGWHVGTIGIVASRLCHRYHLPVAVAAFDGQGTAKGSCRSIDALNILDALSDTAGVLRTYGGHHMAAGFSLDVSDFQAFREGFEGACRQRLDGVDITPCQKVDAWMMLGEADEALLKQVERLQPLGMGNPSPVWGVRNVRLVSPPRKVGKEQQHLKMTVAAGGSQMDAIAFNFADRAVPDGELDILFQLQENTFRGRNLQLNIKDFRPAQK